MAVEDMIGTDADEKPRSKEETLVLSKTGQRGVPHRTFRKLGHGLPLEEALFKAVDEFSRVTYQAEGSISGKRKQE